MAFDPNTDIRPSDRIILETIKYDPSAILKCITGLAEKTDEYSVGVRGVLMQMFDFISHK